MLADINEKKKLLEARMRPFRLAMICASGLCFRRAENVMPDFRPKSARLDLRQSDKRAKFLQHHSITTPLIFHMPSTYFG